MYVEYLVKWLVILMNIFSWHDKGAPTDKCAGLVYSPGRSVICPTDCYSSAIDTRL